MMHRIFRCAKTVYRQCRYASTLLLLSLFVSLSAVPVHGQTKYQFSSIPELVSGSPLAQGAIYRFEQVADGVDALVRIQFVKNATVLQIDQSKNRSMEAFQPQIKADTSDAFVDFEIALVAHGSNTRQSISTVVSALDLDTATEYDQFFSVSDFTVESDSYLRLAVTNPQILTASGGSTVEPTTSFPHTKTAVSVRFRDVQSIVYRVGVREKSIRQASLLFAPLDFVNAAHTNINSSPNAQNDTGIVNVNTTLVAALPGLLLNDDDLDNDVLSISKFQVGEDSYAAGATAELLQGHLTIDSDGSYNFVPAPNTTGPVAVVSYVVEDGKGGRDEAILSLSIINHLPSYLMRQVLTVDVDGTVSAVSIDEDENNDGWINSQELQGPVDVRFVLPEGAVIGDRLSWSDGTSEQELVLSTETILAGEVVTTFPAPVDGETIDIVARYYDAAANLIFTSLVSATIDLTPNASPIVSIFADRDNSGFLSQQEHNEQSVVEISLPNTALVNDRVEIRVDTRVTDLVLTPLDIAIGKLDVPVTIPAQGNTLSVLVKIFDEAGNVSEIGSDSVLVDTVAPVPPIVDPRTTTSSTPVITGSVPIDGDFILSVSVNGVVYAAGDGNLAETGDGKWRLKIPELDALSNGIYDVQAMLTDIAGNQSVDITANELYVDLVVPQLSVASSGLVSDPAPLIQGHTDQTEGGVVRVVTIGNVFVCDAKVDKGQWSCRSRIMLPTGKNILLASISDPVGNSSSAEFQLEVVGAGDQDADGIPDDVEGMVDTDSDGIANYLDLDSDNDTISDYLETAIDTDGDQIRDFLDLDSDNDTLSDLLEAGFSTLVDRDNNGKVDTAIIVGDNGLADVIETVTGSGDSLLPRDSDNDGIYDYIDSDSDNDSIEDVIEQGVYGSVGLSASDMQDDLTIQEETEDAVLFAAIDTDLDGIADYLDLDSDQDGVPDLLEALVTDTESNAGLENIVDVNRDGVSDQHVEDRDLDIDGDGVANQKDLDSDADGFSDLIESGGVDANLDGIHDGWIDQNKNGISDDVDWVFTNGKDSDEDAIDDLFDADFIEGSDSDNDSIVDSFDVDSNGDGRLDVLNDISLQFVDANHDGVPDVFEPNLKAAIATGTGPFGCSLSVSPRSSRAVAIDPTFVLFLFFAFAACARRSFVTDS